MKLSVPLFAAALGLLASLALLDPGVAAAATRHRRGPVVSYPMKAEEYRALMEKRIDGIRATIDRKLDRRGVSADRKKAIHKIFDESSKELRAEIARVAADGTVTQSEADRVKPLAAGLRGKVRERLRAEKNPHAAAQLSKEEAKKEKAKAASPKKASPAGHDAEHPGAHPSAGTHPAKLAGAGPHKTSGHTAAKKAKAPGPTKQAKSSPGKKREHAEVDPGANL